MFRIELFKLRKCTDVKGLFFNLSNFANSCRVLRKGLAVKFLKDIPVRFIPSFEHVLVTCLWGSWIFPVAKQVCLHSQLMIWAWHCWVAFSNLLSHLSL